MKILSIVILCVFALKGHAYFENRLVAQYTGKTPGGEACTLRLSENDGDLRYVTYDLIARGTKYTIVVPKGTTYVEVELIQRDSGYWAPYVDSSWSPFGWGFRTVVLNIVENEDTPISYHLDVKKLFVRDIRCNDLTRTKMN